MLLLTRGKHLFGAAAAAIMLAAIASAAERKVGQTPANGAEATVTVGSPLLKRFNMIVDPGVSVTQNVDIDLGMQGTIRISAGMPMKIMLDMPDKLRACTVAQDTYTNSMSQTGAACLTDRDKDGTFDTASSQHIGLTTRKLDTPVPYTVVDVPENAVSGTNQQQMLIYLGAAAGVLRLSYREFSNDMARPAFTDDLSFPLGPTYPQTITWRDTKIALLGLDNDGLRYRLEAVK